MADYKRRAGSKKKSKSNTNCSIWFFSGAIAGAFVVGLLWLKLGADLAGNHVPGMAQSKPTASKPKKSTPKPTFEFYTILPEMEVVIPDEELMAPEAPESPGAPAPVVTPEPATGDSTAYILQMGSFRKHEDADRMKAKLALIGIEAKIQKVSINNRDTYHRVRSGPYRGQHQLNAVRNLAKQNNIATLVIKLKQ
jgi:cell division protein FtsN